MLQKVPIYFPISVSSHASIFFSFMKKELFDRSKIDKTITNEYERFIVNVVIDLVDKVKLIHITVGN